MRIDRTVSVRQMALCFLLVAVGLFRPAPLVAVETEDVRTTTAIGTSTIYQDRIADARESAIADGLVAAVTGVVAELLPVDTLVDHFPTLNHILFAKPEAFVQGYKVLTEHRYGKKYRVLVQATVMKAQVIREMASVGILQEEQFLPKVLFFVAERNPNAAAPLYWWNGVDSSFLITAGERSLREIMGAKGFTLVGHSFISPDLDIQAIQNNAYIGDAEAAEVGSRLGAEVVVVGAAFAESTLNAMGESLKSYRGTVSIRAVRTATGEKIAEADQNAVAMNADEIAGGRAAIAAAGKLAAEALCLQIAEVWKKESAGAQVVEMTVTGTRNLVEFVTLRKAVSATPGVNRIQLKEISGDQATVIVDFGSDADELANALMLNDFGTFGIEIFDVTPGRLSLKIVQAAQPPGLEPAPEATGAEASDAPPQPQPSAGEGAVQPVQP